MDKRKRGIALLMTLMSIATIMTIMAVSFSYLDQANKSALSTSALTQANILYGNTNDVLKRFFPAKADNSAKLKMIYSMPLMISEEKSGFAIDLTCHPLGSAVPISWLDEKSFSDTPQKNELAKDIFTYMVNFYNIEDPNALEEMLMQAIIGKNGEDRENIERLKEEKGIFSKENFNKILINYAFTHDDMKVLDIPWDKYFYIGSVSKKMLIDGTYPTAEFVSATFDISLEIVKDSWVVGESTLSSFLTDNGIIATLPKKVYAQKALNAMFCEQNFLYKEKRYGFKFNYIEGRSSNFEFSGQEE